MEQWKWDTVNPFASDISTNLKKNLVMKVISFIMWISGKDDGFCLKCLILSPQTVETCPEISLKISSGLKHKCWNAVSNCGHWLDSLLACKSTIIPYTWYDSQVNTCYDRYIVEMSIWYIAYNENKCERDTGLHKRDPVRVFFTRIASKSWLMWEPAPQAGINAKTGEKVSDVTLTFHKSAITVVRCVN